MRRWRKMAEFVDDTAPELVESQDKTDVPDMMPVIELDYEGVEENG